MVSPVRLATQLFLITLLCAVEAIAQQTGPQPWWPRQPRELPLVHPLFADNMVLQRDLAAPVWGWSAPGDRVVVRVDGAASGEPAIAGKDGRWMTRLAPGRAGGPHAIVVEGGGRKQAI